MNLGFYYHIPAIDQNGKIIVPGYLGRFLDSLAENFDELTLFLHRPDKDESANFDYSLQAVNIRLVLLPERGSAHLRTLLPHRFTDIIKNYVSGLAGVLLRAPSPLVPSIAHIVGKKKTIFLVVGDYLAGVASLSQPRWRKEAIYFWSWYYELQQQRAMKNCLVFVNSRQLYNNLKYKIGNLKETYTTTLTKNDLFFREDTCQHRPIQLLYTGRMDPAKGLFDMVEALALLIKAGEDVELNLVGWAEKGSPVIDQIFDVAHSKGVKDRVKFHGYKAVGPDLFSMYKQADIYLIASQSSFEGFPRTIWEAMAHCLPVVATQVGSIPDFIEGFAELIPPKNSDQLAKSIIKVIANQNFRQGLISKGFQKVQDNCLEILTKDMSSTIKDWLSGIE